MQVGVAHGFPRIDAQGVLKFLAILSSFKIAQRSARLVAVSAYVQRHLAALFDIQCVAAVHNPLPACCVPAPPAERHATSSLSRASASGKTRV